jgi:GTPase SAR1 family protein
MKRYFYFLAFSFTFPAFIFGMAVVLQKVAVNAMPHILNLAIIYQHKQQPIQLPSSLANIQPIQIISTKQASTGYSPLSAEFVSAQLNSPLSFSLESVLQNNSLANTMREHRFLSENDIRIKNMHICALFKTNPAFKQAYERQLESLANLIIAIHNPNEQVRLKSRIILSNQAPFYGPHYEYLRQAYFALLPPICEQDGTLKLTQHVNNGHLDAARALRELFIDDDNTYIYYLEKAYESGILEMKEIWQQELNRPGSTGKNKSWSDISKITWPNKANLFNKARTNTFNNDMLSVIQLFEQGRLFEAERLFKTHASQQLWMDAPVKHAELYQFFFSFSNEFDISYGILNKYHQDPFWKNYQNKQVIQQDFLDYKDQKISYPASISQLQSSLKARDQLKQACVKIYALTDGYHDIHLNDYLYSLVDLGNDCQKHVEYLYKCWHDPQHPYHDVVKKYFFNDQGILKVAINNHTWRQISETTQQKNEVQRHANAIQPEQVEQICSETGILKKYLRDPWWINFSQKEVLRQQYSYYKNSPYHQLPSDIKDINTNLQVRYTIVGNLCKWSKLPENPGDGIIDFLYNLIDTAPNLTSCIEGFNRLLLNVHHSDNADLARHFFNEKGLLRMYEDDYRAQQFQINKELSWPVQRQITEYANKILSLHTSENTPLVIFEQLDRAWNYINTAGLAHADDQALVFAYIADGIFQALTGSEFHSELFRLPYLFDSDPGMQKYERNYKKFQKIAGVLSLHEAQKNGVLFNSHGNNTPPPPHDNGGPNPPPPPSPHHDPKNNHGDDPNNDPKDGIVIPATVAAKELCEHHEVIDEAELALIHWFNKLDVAVKNNIRLANNFFTHIRYGNLLDKTQEIKGAHTQSAQCCFDFRLLRTISGGHKESYGKFLYQGIEKTSSIFNNFNSQKLIQQITKAFELGFKESGAGILSDRFHGARRIIVFQTECGMRYLLQATNGITFDTCCPLISFMNSPEGQNLIECVNECL